jgi:hypothetical protein
MEEYFSHNTYEISSFSRDNHDINCKCGNTNQTKHLLIDHFQDKVFQKDLSSHKFNQLIEEDIVGNLIPDKFYDFFRTASGRPDFSVRQILSDILYWYRPKHTTCPKTGLKIASKKFHSDTFQTSYAQLKEKHKLSRETIRQALKRLEDIGLIIREFRTMKVYGQIYNNVMFIHLNSTKISEILNFNSENSTKTSEQDDIISSTKNISTSTPIKKHPQENIETATYTKDTQNSSSNFLYPIQLNGGRGPSSVGYKYKDYNKNTKEAKSYGLSFFSFGFRFGEFIYPIQKNSSNLICNMLNINTNTNPEYDCKMSKDLENLKFEPSLILPEEAQEIAKKDKNLQKSYLTDFKQKEQVTNNISQLQAQSSSKSWSFDDYKLKPASEFLPLSPEFCDIIRSQTGKDFPDSYFENIAVRFMAEDESKRFAEISTTRSAETFDEKIYNKTSLKWSKKQLQARLVAWTMRELKNMSQIALEFGIKSELEIEEMKSLEKAKKAEILGEEQMISRYENSKDTSMIGTLKCKIAGSFSREEAATLLANSSFSINQEAKQITAKIVSWNNKTEKLLCTNRKIDYSKKLLLEQSLKNIACSLLGQGAKALVLYDTENSMKNGEINIPDQNQSSIVTYSNNELYQKIQRFLCNKFGEKVYRSWFSKLEFYRVKDSVTRSSPEDISMILSGMFLPESSPQRIYGESVYVTAPTKFMSDWVKNNYSAAIEQSFKEIGIKLLCIKSVTEGEFKSKLLDMSENEGNGLEIVDSSVVMQDPKNPEGDGSAEYSAGEADGDRYLHAIDLEEVSIAS